MQGRTPGRGGRRRAAVGSRCPSSDPVTGAATVVLTRAGWTVAIVAGGLVAVGRLLGIFELFLLGAAGAVLVIGALFVVRRTPLRLDVLRTSTRRGPRRHPEPGRAERAQPQQRAHALLTVRDPVGRGRSATVALAPLGRARPCGPPTACPPTAGDPPGRPPVRGGGRPVRPRLPLHQGAPVTELTVWPAVVDVDPLPHTMSDDPHGGADQASAVAGGEDFYALRPYAGGRSPPGALALDGPVGRAPGPPGGAPWQGRATVLLDSRQGHHTRRRSSGPCPAPPA